MKILIVGDLHLSNNLSYSEFVKDRRSPEKKEILDFIIDNGNDCDDVVILGDIFNVYNSPSEVIKEFTNFIEKFGNKNVYIISGNHDSRADGKATIDYLKEIKGKNWNIISGEIKSIGDYTFLPYLTNSFLGVNSNEEAKEKVMSMIGSNKFLFLHHSISNIFINSSTNTNELPELVLPQEDLSKLFKVIVMGHIHKSSTLKNVLVAGSIFTHSTDDSEKFIWKLDTETYKIEKIKLPGRRILKIENPTNEQVDKIQDNSIVKVIITKKIPSLKIEELKEKLEKKFNENGGYILIDQTKIVRDRVDYNDSIIDFSMDKLLEIYSNEKEVDLVKLKQGFELIK